ncbi:MAG: 16S rRNA (guanine(966)-N(2))-methyltransferase RsmD [Chloroflexi bacterium]|nr:16S rRNA (guanine(966)-N(2))-methyltransferase RsmD [Chloroflexota bacterium]
MLIVTGGIAKGTKLKLPDEKITRPTSQKMREALFAIIENFGIDFKIVFDLYAGSGMLGIEALSRGADSCIFIESNKNICKIIKNNLKSTNLISKSEVLNASVGKWKVSVNNEPTLILVDPPFNDELKWIKIEKSLGDLSFYKDLILVIEHFHKDDAPEFICGINKFRSRRHGDSIISFYKI